MSAREKSFKRHSVTKPSNTTVTKAIKLNASFGQINHGHGVDPTNELCMLTSSSVTLFTDEETCLPQLKITHYWVSNDECDAVPFSDGLIEAGQELFLNGWVKDVTSDSSATTDGIPVSRMGPIAEWWFSGFDGSEGIIIGLETCYASYVLMDPHPSYSQVVQSILDKLYLCKLIIETLSSSPEIALTELFEIINERSNCRFSEECFIRHSNFLIQQIANYDEAGTSEDIKILYTQAMKDFIDFNVTTMPKTCVRNARRDSRKMSNNDNFTITTPLVRQFFSQIFSQTLENLSQNSTCEISAPINTVIKKPKIIKWTSEIIYTDKKFNHTYYSSGTIDSKNFCIGDFLTFSSKNQEQNKFGQIKMMYETNNTKKLFHVLLLKSGSETILGSTSPARLLFEVNECQNIELSSNIHPIIVESKSSVIKSMEQVKSSRYFCDKRYDKKTGWFFDIPRGIFNSENICPICESRNQKKSVVINDQEKSLLLNGMKYFSGDFVLLDPDSYNEINYFQQVLKKNDQVSEDVDDEKYPEYFRKKLSPSKGVLSDCINMYNVARIEDYTRVEDSNIQMKVRKLLRPWNIFKNFKEIVETDINEVFYTNYFVTIFPHQIVRKIANGDFYIKRQVDEGNTILDFDIITNLMANNIKIPIPLKLRGLDLFCGAGGLAKGFEEIIDTKWAVERDHSACESFKKNFPSCDVFQEDANKILEQILNGDRTFAQDSNLILPMKGEVDIILAGPPCQGFSNMNRFSGGTYSLFKNSLIATTLSYIDHFRPKYVYIENVRNFFKFNKGLIFKLTLSCLIRMNYQVSFCVLQAGCYGVPQARNRAFIIAALNEHPLPKLPPFFNAFPVHQIKSTLLIDGKRLQLNVPIVAIHRPLTVYDAISDLPRFVAYDREAVAYRHSPNTSFQRDMREQSSSLVRDHVTRTPSLLNQARMDRIPLCSGSDWRDLPNIELALSDGSQIRKLVYRYHDSKSLKMRGVCICSDGKNSCSDQSERQDMTLIPWCLPHTAHKNQQWTGVFGRLGWDETFSTTVTIPEPISKQGRVIHPIEPRVISVREAARSQGFPDDFIFCGKITDKYRQIGNAVPPPLARALSSQLEDAIKSSHQQHP